MVLRSTIVVIVSQCSTGHGGLPFRVVIRNNSKLLTTSRVASLDGAYHFLRDFLMSKPWILWDPVGEKEGQHDKTEKDDT